MRTIILICISILITISSPANGKEKFSISGTMTTSFLTWNMVHLNDEPYELTLQGGALYSSDMCRLGLWGSWVANNDSAAREIDIFGGCQILRWLDVSLYYMDIGPDIGDSANWITTQLTISGSWGALTHRYAIETSHLSSTGFQDVRFDFPHWKTRNGDFRFAVAHKWTHHNGPRHTGAQIKWRAPKKWQFDIGGIELSPSVQIYKTIGDLDDHGIVLSLEIQ